MVDHNVCGDAAWQQALLQSLGKQAKSTSELLKLLQLYPTEACPPSDTFQVMDPVLFHSNLSKIDAAKLFQRVLIHDRIVPAMSYGEKSVEELLELSRALVTANLSKPDNLDLRPPVPC